METIVLSAKQRWLKKKVGAEWDDILQDARLRCLSQTAQPYYEAYLSRAITNAAINFLRHRTSVELVSITDREDKPFDPEMYYEVNFETNYDVRRFMLSRWSAQERDVIYMFFTRQIPVRVASDMLGTSRSTAQRWLTDVKKQFQERMAA